KLHGTGGPLHIGAPAYVVVEDVWIAAGQEVGLTLNDPNGYQNESVFPIDTTTIKGTRFSTHAAYLHPALGRPNLKVVTYAHVLKVHLDDKNKATGVSYIHKGKELTVTADKEIILSAGAISSPQILMLSGIVDKGKSIMADRDFNSETLRNYLSSGSGPYSTVGTGPGAMVSSSIRNNPGHPDIYLTFMNNGIHKEFPLYFELGNGLVPGTLQKYMAADVVIPTTSRLLSKVFKSGTCRMGKASGDPRAVLDSKLRVLGATGLRVFSHCQTYLQVVSIGEGSCLDGFSHGVTVLRRESLAVPPHR
ncbi:unnamed protein product, partial [Allacma fusca]